MSEHYYKHPVMGVSELTRQIRQGLESLFTNIWVEGEVSNYTQSSLGHVYFVLKDQSCQIKVAIFKTQLAYLKFRPKDGMQIIIHGNVSIYEKRGEYQLIGDYIEPKGVGALQVAYEELKNRLQKEGLFDPAHKKTLPFLPRTIGIVTSPSGAVLHDILTVSFRRFPNLRVIINPIPVQGDCAASLIARAIAETDTIPEVDVIILARGGGSFEDLFCFNEEAVARAIYAAKKPVVSAVGHETDFTIADFVADLRAPTPSAAAEMVVKDKEQLCANLNNFQRLLNNNIQQNITDSRHRLINLKQFPAFASPKAFFISQRQQELDDYNQRMNNLFLINIKQARIRVHEFYQSLLHNHPDKKVNLLRHDLTDLTYRLRQSGLSFYTNNYNKLTNLTTAIDALSPLNVLKRGYSICQKKSSSAILNNADSVNLDELIQITLYKGKLICKIIDKEEKNV